MSLAPEPAEFDKVVRTPGLRSVHEMCGEPVPAALKRTGGKPFEQRSRVKKDASGKSVSGADGNPVREPITRPGDLPTDELKPYWTEAIHWLLEAYDRVCAFCCFRIHTSASPSVDHMVPKSRAWDKAYEWSNYRLASLRLNASKGIHDVIDPFDVQPGWFALEFTFGQVVPGPIAAADPVLRKRVEDTIRDLGLNEFAKDRVRDLEDYERGEVGIERLRVESPFVALELERQGRLRPGGGRTSATADRVGTRDE